MAHLYTQLFADGRLPLAAVEAVLTAAVAGRVESGTIYGGGCAINASANDDHSPDEMQRDPTDFIYFPYTIDVEAASEGMGLKRYLGVVATVMKALAGSGMRVVAACDWEERLPGGGRLGV